MQILNALNLCMPEDESSVRSCLSILNSQYKLPKTKTSLKEQLEYTKFYEQLHARYMEFLDLFTQIKMGQVNESVKLKLSALRHQGQFDSVNRTARLDMRVSKNVEYFQKTDINGILTGFQKNITSSQWKEIDAIKEDWVDTYSTMDLLELMKDAPDNILCLGILVKRDVKQMDDPVKALTIRAVSNTLISFDSFVRAMTIAKNNNELYIVGSRPDDKFNAVIPLYLHECHFARVRILEGIMLGHLYTLDSYGYDKVQEISIVYLWCMLMKSYDESPNQKSKAIVHEFGKLCQWIVQSSEGFRTAYGVTMLRAMFVKQNAHDDRSIIGSRTNVEHIHQKWSEFQDRPSYSRCCCDTFTR